MAEPDELYGVIAEYDRPDVLAAAARAARRRGYRHVDAYSPFPVPEIAADGARAGGARGPALVGAFLGGGLLLLLQWWSSVVDYPINVGGRPLASWLPFAVSAVQTAAAGAAVFVLVWLLRRCGLPRLHHLIFEAPGFERASSDRFFLCIAASDPRFEAEEVRRALAETGARSVADVRWP